MTTINSNTLHVVIQSAPKDAVILSSFLVEKGISHDLQKSYVRNNWLKRIGRGAFVFSTTTPSLEGALKQAKLSLHVGGISALRIHGSSHFLQMDSDSIVEQVFKLPSEKHLHGLRNRYSREN